MCNESKVIDVLLVEDDEGDVLMTREAFEHYKIRNRLHVVSDGEQALQFLHQTGPYADAPRPGLVLLDVNLPRRSGLEVLAELKQDDELLIDPGDHADHLASRRGHRAQLLAARQRVCQQAGRLRALHRGHPADRYVLPLPSSSSLSDVERLAAYWDKQAGRYDREMDRWDRRLFGESRPWVCGRAAGDVLEVAVGTGRNLPFYPDGVRLTGVDSVAGHARHRARARGRPGPRGRPAAGRCPGAGLP